MRIQFPMNPRRAASALSLALLGGLMVACADAPSSPRAAAEPSLAAPTAAPSRAAYVGAQGDTALHEFTLDPAVARVIRVGAHEVHFPTSAICDPTTSGYGPGTWDSACTPAAQAITFTTRTWTDAAGHPRIRFSPDVRFVPAKTVTLYLYDKDAALDRKFASLWCATGATTCVNEAIQDPSVALHRDPGKFFLYGRIKHFSGYNVVVD